jgi:hypothetical protein
MREVGALKRAGNRIRQVPRTDFSVGACLRIACQQDRLWLSGLGLCMRTKQVKYPIHHAIGGDNTKTNRDEYSKRKHSRHQ